MRLLGFLRPYRASLIVSTVLAIAAQVAAILVLVVTLTLLDFLDMTPGLRRHARVHGIAIQSAIRTLVAITHF